LGFLWHISNMKNATPETLANQALNLSINADEIRKTSDEYCAALKQVEYLKERMRFLKIQKESILTCWGYESGADALYDQMFAEGFR